MKFVARHGTGFLALGLGFLVFWLVFLHADRVGYTRDEGYYFAAAERYAGWFKELGSDPGQALSAASIEKYYQTNKEHPVLVKNLMALSYLCFSPQRVSYQAGQPAPERGSFARAMRLPAHLFTALGAALLFLLGSSLASRRVGLFASLAFLLAPRHFYHGQLACFDMPVTVLWLATVMAYRRSRHSLAWAVATGLIWGLAIAVKHNAFFLPPLLVLHWLWAEGKSFSISRQGFRMPRIPLAFPAMALLGPLVFYLHWPLLWHQPIEHLQWYFGFHLHHVNYYWEYFGTLLTDAPFPWLYPFAVTALTLPAPTLLLGLGALLAIAGGRLRGYFCALPAASPTGVLGLDAFDRRLLILNALVPVLIIALPAVPIFGGMKHWLHAMPFFCLLAGLCLDRWLRALPKGVRPRLALPLRFAAVALLALLPSLLGLIRVGPYGSAFYNSLAGGVAGAADLGMQRQYWSDNVTGVLPWLNQNLPRGSRVYLHEVNSESAHAYRRDGWLRADLRTVWNPDHADVSVIQYHREFVDAEYRVWNKLGHKQTVYGFYLEEVPMVLVYSNQERD